MEKCLKEIIYFYYDLCLNLCFSSLFKKILRNAKNHEQECFSNNLLCDMGYI